MFGKGDLQKQVEQSVTAAFERAIKNTKSALGMSDQIARLQEQIDDLTIAKKQIKFDQDQREREVEHKVGLERKRQEFEIEQTKREALVSIREENLDKDKARFAEQMTFHEERFTEEVGYLKSLVEQVLKRLPNISMEVGGKKDAE
ncbi:hypothetical protein LCGC14_2314540 [marine sediment metagenome]|uniref:Uncharacterized protein n=1 Tax=marine sediment metagenome TaxID=412755 RepID=A0A0F9EX44_9ZZZZ